MKSLGPTTLNGQKTDSLTGVDETGPFRFVIVDDDQNDRCMMRQELEKTGEFVCVGTYRSANEALVEIPKVHPHVVLMDIRMPDMSGIECTRRLKGIAPRLIIIMVSGLHQHKAVSQAMEAGADDYLA